MHAPPIVTFLAMAHSFFMFRPQPAHHADARSNGELVASCAYSLRSTRRGLRGPLVASPFLQSGAVKPAQPSRKNGAATSRPPAPVGSLSGSRAFSPPARALSRRLQRASVVRPVLRRGQPPRQRAAPSERIIALMTRAPRARTTHADSSRMRDMMGQMMGSMWIWTIVGVLLIVLLVFAIIKLAKK